MYPGQIMPPYKFQTNIIQCTSQHKSIDTSLDVKRFVIMAQVAIYRRLAIFY